MLSFSIEFKLKFTESQRDNTNIKYAILCTTQTTHYKGRDQASTTRRAKLEAFVYENILQLTTKNLF